MELCVGQLVVGEVNNVVSGWRMSRCVISSLVWFAEPSVVVVSLVYQCSLVGVCCGGLLYPANLAAWMFTRCWTQFWNGGVGLSFVVCLFGWVVCELAGVRGWMLSDMRGGGVGTDV